MRITGADMGIADKADWVYSDLPNLTREFFDKYIEIIGENHIHWITMAKRDWPDGQTTYRGQHLISPEGMINGRNHNERERTP